MEVYDTIIIGGGVIGIALLHHATMSKPPGGSRSRRILLLEQAPRLLSGASRGNSAMIHTGFDAAPGTLEANMVRRGHALFYAWCEARRRQGIPTPYKRNGAIMPAWTPEEEISLTEVKAKADANGVSTRRMTAEEVYVAEPCLAHGVRCALAIPGETSVDPWMIPTLYLAEALLNGKGHVSFVTKSRVVATVRDPITGTWTVTTAKGQTYCTRRIINAAGLRGDDVERLRSGGRETVPFEVYPRAGRYLCFHQSSSSLVTAMILPIPTKKTKGIILFPTLYGHVIIGPTAEEPGEKHIHEEVVARLKETAIRKVPLLAHHEVAWEYAGSRPALKGATDYYVSVSEGGTWVCVAGVRSTGLTSSFSLAEHVWRELLKEGGGEKGYPESWRHVAVEALRTSTEWIAVAEDVTHPIGRYGWPAKL